MLNATIHSHGHAPLLLPCLPALKVLVLTSGPCSGTACHLCRPTHYHPGWGWGSCRHGL